MNQTRFLNTHHPQTLLIGTLLLYVNGAFLALFQLTNPLALGLGLALAAGGYGIANDQKWGYNLGVFAAVANFVLLLVVVGIGGILSFALIDAAFDIALIALLLHPQSSDYQKLWFK